MSNQQWWYEQGGQPKGPLGSDEIRSMVETGALARSSRIIVVGGNEWRTIDEHAGELGLGPVGAPGIGTAAPPGPAPAQGPQAAGAPFGAPAGAGYQAPAYAAGTATAAALPLVSNGKRFGSFLLEGLLSAVTLGIGWLIWAFVILGKGQTPAKQLLRMRVVDSDTRTVPGYGTMALRVFIYQGVLASFTFGISTIVGGVMILKDKELRQGLWDRMAHTVVVDDPDGRALA